MVRRMPATLRYLRLGCLLTVNVVGLASDRDNAEFKDYYEGGITRTPNQDSPAAFRIQLTTGAR